MDKQLANSAFKQAMTRGISCGLQALWSINTIEALSGRTISDIMFSDNGDVVSIAFAPGLLPDDEFKAGLDRYNARVKDIFEKE